MKAVSNILKARYGAFTLIELLIVVAIIAVLAAIAVPNFLEAQTRSKVSRCMADMRAVAIALESYSADYSKYIPPMPRQFIKTQNFGQVTGWPLKAKYHGGNPWPAGYGAGEWLTTPIAYMSDMPSDGFAVGFAQNDLGARVGIELSYHYISSTKGPFNYFGHPKPVTEIKGIPWTMRSPGPNLYWWPGGQAGTSGRKLPPEDFCYDPTNGTVSGGDIWWVGGGRGFLKIATPP